MKTIHDYALKVENRLGTLLPEPYTEKNNIGEIPYLLTKSMRYSLLAGGKRLRPSMLLATVDMLGANPDDVLDFACAVEMIHTYSLIHDDLPGMDNDSLRRGRPTNHVVFGEGQAILAGDGLLNLAFEAMLKASLNGSMDSKKCLQAISEIACGSGVTGMIAGQVLDLYCENKRVSDEESLFYIQRNKTSCMFIYPMRAGGRLADASEAEMAALEQYALAFGLLFQATDDLLDVIGTSQAMGKTLGKDAESGKLTCVSVYGIDGTRELIAQQEQKAMDALSVFGSRAAFFAELVHSMVGRTH